MKDAVLGKDYDLSVVFVGKTKIQSLNKTYRKMDSPTDILSFPLSEKSGEIYICLDVADKKSLEFERSPRNFLDFLFIHGLVHLLGHDHSDAMEKIEEKFRKKFNI